MRILEPRRVSVWYVGLLKFALFSLGLAIGARWSATFEPWIPELVGFGVVVGIGLALLWFRR